MTEAIVTIEAVSFQYDGASAPVLQNVDLTVYAGETVLLLGPGGCGKSSLLLCLNGVVPQKIAGQFSGRVTVSGRDVAAHEVYELAEHVGIVFQDPEAQFCTLYVEDEVAFGLENLRYARDVMRERVAWALQQVGLSAKAGARLDQLSGGQQQKVALASVLAMAPDVLVCDAPTAHLDPVAARDFFALLRRLKRELGQTIIIVEQQVDTCIDMVDRLVLMNQRGQIIGNGPPSDVIAGLDPEMLDRYGIWTPQMWDLVDMLRRQGMPVATYPLTVEDAYARLAPVLNNGYALWKEPAEALDGCVSNQRPAILRVAGLSHTYAAAPVRTTALRDVHIDICAGDFCAIVGQNGAGKTTLAKYLTRILNPPRGTVFFNGADIAGLPLRDLIRSIGYVFQNPEHQFVAHTVYDELAYSLRIRGCAEDTVRARVLETLDMFHMHALMHSRPFTLSRGEQRQLSVATMLIAGPDVLILDEPTIGLDKAAATKLMDALRQMNAQGQTIIFITHDMRLVAEYARSVIVLAHGSAIFQGTVRELFDQPAVMDAAALLPPPLVALVQQVRAAYPAFPALTSVRELRQLLPVA